MRFAPSRRRLAGLLLCALVALPALPARAHTGPTATAYADPATVADFGMGRYLTYSTSITAAELGCVPQVGRLLYWVPYIASLPHVETSDLTGACVTDDAMPAGPGPLVDPVTLWAPSVVDFGGQWLLYFAGEKAGTNQRCIYRAVAGGPTGPFTNVGEWACPPAGRWAIDPEAFVDNDSLFVVYRDDGITTGYDSGISVVRTDSNGWAVWDSRVSLFTSRDVSWAGTYVESPSLVRLANGTLLLLYSGNQWNGPRYATGLADCTATFAGSGRDCTPVGDPGRPYFGYVGSGGGNPLHGLPGNGQGPGGMSAFRSIGGATEVVWHDWAGGPRHVLTGRLVANPDGSYAVI